MRQSILTVVDLFAGTGGMGLAAMLAPAIRDNGSIVFCGEQNDRYVRTINKNYAHFAGRIGQRGQTPATVEPTDLSQPNAAATLRAIRRHHGTIDLLLAGPPCQGYSLANRRSRDRTNPLNSLSLTAIEYVKTLRPRIFLLENVPGIRTISASRKLISPALAIAQRRLGQAGYLTQTRMLDAADFGVPQHRLRSFLVAVDRRAFNLNEGEISLFPGPSHGPGTTQAFVTVEDAFADMPPIDNGSTNFREPYKTAPETAYQRAMRRHSHSRYLYDHVASRHADYVISRFRNIPPGANWMQIRAMLTNYADVSRTHRNVYYRLDPKIPSRTIGHFRKAMTIHPWESRGLSLREACRLQSIPDWLRFVDEVDIEPKGIRGLDAYQQQVGNAVCFRLTQAIVAHLAAQLEI